MLLSLFACAEPTEAERFTAALAAGGLEVALEQCRQIDDGFVAGECSAAALSQHGPDLEGCRALTAALWRDECVFMAAEALAVEDLRAGVDACHDSSFARECSFHLIRDEARGAVMEDAASASVVAGRLVDIRRAPDARFIFWQEWFVAGRAADLPANPDRCEGAADPLDCIEGLRRLSHQTARGLGPEKVCARLSTGPLAERLEPGEEIRAELMDLCEARD